MACEGTDHTGLTRNHTNSRTQLTEPSSVHMKQRRNCQDTGRAGGSPGTSHRPSQGAGQLGGTESSPSPGHQVPPRCSSAGAGQGCGELEIGPAAVSLGLGLMALGG